MMNRCMARRGGLVAGVALGLVTASANAGVYFTFYTLNTPYTVTSPDVTQVLMSWSTNQTSGIVDQADLTDWSISFLNGGNLFYTDNISQETWRQWIGQGTKVINELRLDFTRDRDQEIYDQQMREYLGIDEEAMKEIAAKG